MQSAEMLLHQSPREVAFRLVSSCGSSEDAISTLIDGATKLFGNPTESIADRLAAITAEIAAMKTKNHDAFRLIHTGRTRKGGTPNVKRFL